MWWRGDIISMAYCDMLRVVTRNLYNSLHTYFLTRGIRKTCHNPQHVTRQQG